MQSLFVVGCPRSGASVVAAMQANCDLLPFREAHKPTLSNPQGVFESVAVQECNGALMAALTPPEQCLLEGQHWLARLEPGLEYSVVDEIKVAIRERLARPGCLKESSFTWTLPAWLEESPNSPIVCVFRSPVATAQSIVRACEQFAPTDRPRINLALAYEIWIAHYERVLRLLRRRGRWHFFHLNQAFTGEGLDALEAHTGHALQRSVPLPELRTSSCAADAPARARELYAGLCKLANFEPEEAGESEADPASSPEVALVIPILERHRPHLPRLLRELSNQRHVRAEVILIDQTTDGNIEAGGATVLREPNPSRGLAYQRALEHSQAPFIAWQDPRVSLFPQRLARQLAKLKAHPEAQLCTSDLAICDGQGQIQRRIAVDLGPATPLPFWQSGVLLKRAALEDIELTTFVPAELQLFIRLQQAGRTVHLAETLGSVSTQSFDGLLDREQEDAELLRLAERPTLERPVISVLLASHNRKEALTECLEALSRQLLPRGTFEIIVIDDGSRDGTQELFRSMQLPVPLRFLEQANTGAASARNRGLPHVRGEYVLFINDDTILFPGAIRGHLEAHRELADQSAIVLGTFEQPAEECQKPLTRLLEKSALIFAYSSFHAQEDCGGTSFYTCNLSLPTSAVRAAGAFDEQFPLFGEDTDYGLRLENMGYRILYRPEIRSTHRHVLPYEVIWRRQVAASKAHVRVCEKHPRTANETMLIRTLAGMEERESLTRPFIAKAHEMLANLGSINLTALERSGSGAQVSAAQLEACFNLTFPKVNVHLWELGFVEVLKHRGIRSFKELLAQPRPAMELTKRPTQTSPTQIFAWPRWESEGALQELVDAMAPLVGRADLCVVLRHDPEIDGDVDQSIARLSQLALERYGCQAELNVLLESSRSTPDLLPRLATGVSGFLCAGAEALPAKAWNDASPLPRFADATELAAWIDRQDQRGLLQPPSPAVASAAVSNEC